MKYCVIKDTTKIVDGSENSQDIMLRNAINAGLTAEEIEIFTEEEFETRKALEPTLPQEPTEIEMMRDYVLDVDYRLVMMELGL
jgi:hypothetical protein